MHKHPVEEGRPVFLFTVDKDRFMRPFQYSLWSAAPQGLLSGKCTGRYRALLLIVIIIS